MTPFRFGYRHFATHLLTKLLTFLLITLNQQALEDIKSHYLRLGGVARLRTREPQIMTRFKQSVLLCGFSVLQTNSVVAKSNFES